MKAIIRYLIILPLFAVTSCLRESFEINDPCPCDNEKMVTLKLALPYAAPQNPVTRSIGAAQENAIETLDILAFQIDEGVETFLYRVEAKKDAGNNDGASLQQFNTKIFIKDFPQRFVLISNARSKIQTLIASRQDGWVGQEKEDMLKNLTVDISSSGYRWMSIDATNYTKIPMWGETAPISISAATTSISDAPVIMLRMVAKIEVQLDGSDASLASRFKLKSVFVFNTNATGRIVPKPGVEYVDENRVAKKASIPVPVATSPSTLLYSDFTPPGIPDVAMKGAIYLLETAAKNMGNPLEETAIVVGGIYGTDTKESFYRLDFFTSNHISHADILRNHKYTFNITEVSARGYDVAYDAFYAKSSNMVANLSVWDEGQIRNIHFNDNYMLGVSHNCFWLNDQAHNAPHSADVLKVITDYPFGWKAEIFEDRECTSKPDIGWINLSSFAGAGGAQPDEIGIISGGNYQNHVRTAFIRIKAGVLTSVIEVKQSVMVGNIPGIGEPINENTYVGAFWKAEQTGERVIRIPVSGDNIGPWRAEVKWYDDRWNPAGGDGIVLATGRSPDPNLSYTTDSTPGNAENFPVTTGSTFIEGDAFGTNHILFRIGLQKKSSETASWNFEPVNPNYTTTFPARYAVIVIYYGPCKSRAQKLFLRQGEGGDYVPGMASGARWSVYNVNNNFNFTDFPTKAGYFYQFSSTPTAFAPIGPAPGLWPDPSGETTMANVCPTNYIVPTGGPSSNLTDILTASFTWGYYADGYFDRRQIVNSPGNSLTNSAVAVTTNNVAYSGRLFFNVSTNASIFFPSAGFRSTTGTLTVNAAYYLSRTPHTSTGNAWAVWMTKTSNNQGASAYGSAQSVRCVCNP